MKGVIFIIVEKDKQCILCPYKHEEDCIYNHEKCYSLSNIYYGKICQHFPFKQIEDFKTERAYKKEEKDNQKMNKKYGDYLSENDDMKFIWGITSYDDLSGHNANIYTMNDIDIIYNKKDKNYYLGIETAYMFENYKAKCDYLNELLNAFTKYMDDNRLDKNKEFMLFMSNPSIEMRAETIEELYTNFKLFVKGYERIGE